MPEPYLPNSDDEFLAQLKPLTPRNPFDIVRPALSKEQIEARDALAAQLAETNTRPDVSKATAAVSLPY